MASPFSILDDVDERLSQCSVCFEEYKNPRQLPCLHRFCSDCLEQLITQSQGVLICPLCQKRSHIPNDGVEGLPNAFVADDLIAADNSPQINKSLTVSQNETQVRDSKKERREKSNLVYRKYLKTNDVRLSEQEESIIDLEGIKEAYGWYIRGMCCSTNGTIVITGDANDKQAHVTIYDMEGEVQERRILDARPTSFSTAPCFCTNFKDHKVAVACDPDEVGIFDVRDCSYHKRNIADVATSWPAGRGIRCIAYDKTNGHIFVGCYKSRELYVLDSNLNYLRSVRLPEKIKWPFDMAIAGGKLYVCDRDGQRACAVNLEGGFLYDFPRPRHNRCREPVSICSDKNGFVYVLWEETWFKCEQDSIITQYSQDGRTILSSAKSYTDSGCITTLESGKSAKLFMATWSSAKLFVYNLVNQNTTSKT